jgi:hypothetical protein
LLVLGQADDLRAEICLAILSLQLLLQLVRLGYVIFWGRKFYQLLLSQVCYFACRLLHGGVGLHGSLVADMLIHQRPSS